ncbi:hypothetical protein ACIQ9P_32070 [Kitasatospora sp. NPDC094019]|uniref:hypothetical protein n=1 Tax=Kitasatospora sp. NPDC094019 TaxID=3364091 RepID=UPI0037FCFD4A
MSAIDLAGARRRIDPLLGQRAWNVRRGIGSYVSIEFGHPLPADGRGNVHGHYHLWIMMAAWRLETADQVIVGSEDPDQDIDQALARLEGRRLTEVLIRPPALETRFDFAGLRLETFPIFRHDPQEGEYDHWLLRIGDGDALVAGSEMTIAPRLRAP